MTRHLGFAALAGLLLATSGKAQVSVSSDTFSCQQAATKAVAKFEGKVAGAIEKCLLGVMKCNQQSGPANDRCVADLLVLDTGKCAAGKLQSNAYQYYGPGAASTAVSSQDASTIGKALIGFAKALGKCAPGLGVDYAALNFADTNPADVYAVADTLNTVPDGAACLAHKRVLRTIPSRDQLAFQLLSHSDGGNAGNGLLLLLDTGGCQ